MQLTSKGGTGKSDPCNPWTGPGSPSGLGIRKARLRPAPAGDGCRVREKLSFQARFTARQCPEGPGCRSGQTRDTQLAPGLHRAPARRGGRQPGGPGILRCAAGCLSTRYARGCEAPGLMKGNHPPGRGGVAEDLRGGLGAGLGAAHDRGGGASRLSGGGRGRAASAGP